MVFCRLYKYGQSFIHNNFGSDSMDMEHPPKRPSLRLWNRAEVWEKFPELSYNEFMESEEGLRLWLEMFYTVIYIGVTQNSTVIF